MCVECISRLCTKANQYYWKMPPLWHQIINRNAKKAPIIYLRQNIYPSDSFPSQITALASLSCLFDIDIPEKMCPFTILPRWDGCLPAFPLPLLLSNAGNTGVWLLPFLWQTEKRMPHILPLVSLEQMPAEFICVLTASVYGCITLCNTCWCGHSFINFCNRPLRLFLPPDFKSSWDVPSH